MHPLLTTNPHDLVTFLEGYLAKHESVSGLEALPSPRLFSTHCPYTFVYVCRDPRDVISTWNFMNRLTIARTTTSRRCVRDFLSRSFSLWTLWGPDVRLLESKLRIAREN